MAPRDHAWGIVLAAGSGTRLYPLTRNSAGSAVPKQFCSFNDGPSLVQIAVSRARSLVDPARLLAVVAADHLPWWSTQLREFPRANMIVQPCNRGTACGLLLPTLEIGLRDPEAIVLVLPSDHLVEDEQILRSSLGQALDQARAEPAGLVLLGFTPDTPEPSYGWIEAAPARGESALTVTSFVEKPSPEAAERLMRRGALWNSFIFAMRATALLALFERALPTVTRLFSYAILDADGARREERLQRLYPRLPDLDFSRAVLQAAPDVLRVVPVPPCGWTDLGTPDRVARCAARLAAACPIGDGQDRVHPEVPLDLARASLATGARFPPQREP